MSHINTISEFLLKAGTDYRVFDMARGIRPLDQDTFKKIENAQQPAPFPRQQQAWFGIVFFNPATSAEHYIWFVKLPIDEAGLVIVAAQQQFLQIIVDALGQSVDIKNNSQLPDNPFSFVPNQQQLADFNSHCRLALALPWSEHYKVAKDYLSAPAQSDWRNVPLQGIADFNASLVQDAASDLLLEQFTQLAPEMQYALCASLENHPIKPALCQLLSQWYQQAPEDLNRLSAVLRALAQSQTDPQVSSLLLSILSAQPAMDPAILILIAARHWQQLNQPQVLALYIECLAVQDIKVFIGLFSDLVQIPETRDSLLGVLRWPQKSAALTQAVGQLFAQDKL
jgi:hypothetical protein